jgi:anti-sigma factor RsiW
MKHDLELKLQAWLDGELPAAEAEQMRRRAATDLEAARLTAELQNIKAAFLQSETTATVPETRAFYWSRIQREIQRQASVRHSPAPLWAERLRRWLAPVAGLAALAAAVLMALNPSAPRALNQVSAMAEGFQTRAFRDDSAGINFIVFHQAPQPNAALAGATPARIRNDGSSFVTEVE